MQITRFFKQGYTLLETGCESALAAINPQNTELVVAFNNSTESQQDFNIKLDNVVKTESRIKVYRTNSNENCIQLQPVSINNNRIKFSAPALSLTTFVIPLR